MVFEYKLQNILGLKEKLEEQKKIEFGKAMLYLNQQEQLLCQLTLSQDRIIQTFHQKKGASLYAKELKELNQEIQFYEREKKLQKQIVIHAKKEVEIKREALNQALIERKTYEKLKEFAFEAYQEEEKEKSQKQLDEIISFKYSG